MHAGTARSGNDVSRCRWMRRGHDLSSRTRWTSLSPSADVPFLANDASEVGWTNGRENSPNWQASPIGPRLVRVVSLPTQNGGLLLVGQPPSEAHVRMRLYFECGSEPEVIYWDRRGLGTIHLWSLEQIEEHLGPSKLGPDALAISESDFRLAFCELKREVKPALLDQSKVAGIGNLYASEILYTAKVHPERRCNELNRPQWSRIYRASIDILQEAILREGSTLGDGTYRNAQNNPGEYQHQHKSMTEPMNIAFVARLRSFVSYNRNEVHSFVHVARIRFQNRANTCSPLTKRLPHDDRLRESILSDSHQ